MSGKKKTKNTDDREQRKTTQPSEPDILPIVVLRVERTAVHSEGRRFSKFLLESRSRPGFVFEPVSARGDEVQHHEDISNAKPGNCKPRGARENRIRVPPIAMPYSAANPFDQGGRTDRRKVVLTDSRSTLSPPPKNRTCWPHGREGDINAHEGLPPSNLPRITQHARIHMSSLGPLRSVTGMP